jgi:hypothetical protein
MYLMHQKNQQDPHGLGIEISNFNNLTKWSELHVGPR